MTQKTVKYLSKIFCSLIPENLIIFCMNKYFSALHLSVAPEKALRIICASQDVLHAALSQAAIKYEPTGLHPKHRIMHYHDFFVKRVVPGDKVLDVGCGVGAVAYSVAEYGRGKVTAIDISKKNIELASKMHSHSEVQYICGDALEYIPKKDFDVVIMSNVLEHIEDRVGFLRSLVHSLPNARYLIRVPRKDRHWSVYFREELGLKWMLDETHYTEYTYESFTKELEEADLEIVHAEFQWEEIWAEAVHRG